MTARFLSERCGVRVDVAAPRFITENLSAGLPVGGEGRR
jgi:hypothetical protein